MADSQMRYQSPISGSVFLRRVVGRAGPSCLGVSSVICSLAWLNACSFCTYKYRPKGDSYHWEKCTQEDIGYVWMGVVVQVVVGSQGKIIIMGKVQV